MFVRFVGDICWMVVAVVDEEGPQDAADGGGGTGLMGHTAERGLVHYIGLYAMGIKKLGMVPSKRRGRISVRAEFRAGTSKNTHESNSNTTDHRQRIEIPTLGSYLQISRSASPS